MNVFEFRDQLVHDYSKYITSFIRIRDNMIRTRVQESLNEGLLWPEPLIQLNPSFETGESIETLVDRGILHPKCSRIFRKDKSKENPSGKALKIFKHQSEAILSAKQGHNYVLTTGTGSGKSLAYIVPIVDHVLRNGSGRGIQAIIIYPMNALANSQHGELTKFLCEGYSDNKGPVTFEKYTGQESDEERQRIIANPPDILLTNYVMLELILTRPHEKQLIRSDRGLKFLVLDELHTYRGRQGADVAMLVRRVRDRLGAADLQCVGTSATLAGRGTYDQQRSEVAAIATQLFGAPVAPEDVIGETLKRITLEKNTSDPSFKKELAQRLTDPTHPTPTRFEDFIKDPLAIWIENTFGITRDVEAGRLVRKTPRSMGGQNGAAKELSELTGVPIDRCKEAVQEGLLAGYRCEQNPETDAPTFAFRLHQFISRGDMVYASPEREDERYITVYGQQFVPGDRSRALLPLVFCRECGQEYYAVFKTKQPEGKESIAFVGRRLNERGDDEREAGFIYLSTNNPWPHEYSELIERLPDDWLEESNGVVRIRRNRQQDIPKPTKLSADGHANSEGIDCYYVAAPFRFCLNCGVSYRAASDFAKLAPLGSEGRSTATTIMSLFAVQGLRNDETLPRTARKLLSFTDNRQDASLQAGHFNDFVEIGLLRAAIYKAVDRAGDKGLHHAELTQQVFNALDLPLEMYASNPEVKFHALTQTQSALRDVLGYRIYRDLERGWRITSPNLEQCGLLTIGYLSLDEVCKEEEMWRNCHPALTGASPQTRGEVAKVLLDFMRQELAIRVDYLDSLAQERIQQQSSQHLILPWSIDENETMVHASVLYPRLRRSSDYGGNVFVSARSGFGQFVRRGKTFPGYGTRIGTEETTEIIRQLLSILNTAGIVQAVAVPSDPEDAPGYQLKASALHWLASDGSKPFRDPLRIPSASEEGGQTNQFFVDLYRTVAPTALGLEAREHTAQVQYEDRIEREERFRGGQLPILFCSPTMELGVDIAELNVVNMRNIPPTPANYAQRSGRAGRSGQPAFVFSYCSTGSSHDQYFFRQPELMVSGSVTPPRLDLANEDLIRAHIHAVWLSETGQSLGKSLREVLDLSSHDPSLNLLESVRAQISRPEARTRARARAERILATIKDELSPSDWYSDNWLDEVLSQIELSFDRTCNRWRGLFRAALKQAQAQDRIIRDASRSQKDEDEAKRLRREAEAQLNLLTEIDSYSQSDFYSYRYFASEGFLPGYNFPRLPLSAYIPGRRTKQKDEFLSRPRFLAISEFGPRAIVYHEGSRYVINRVILPVGDDEQGDQRVLTRGTKICAECGYLHPIINGNGPDLCEHCQRPLDFAMTNLFRLQNVSTKRRDRINSDEEERMRLGYEIITGFRFAEYAAGPTHRIASIQFNGRNLARILYGHSATLWRINLGWMRRKDRNQLGFVLDTERGVWEKNQQDPEDLSDPMTSRTARVIPYVEDRRNCLIFEPAQKLSVSEMASLQSALKNAIQVHYQLEDTEIATEPLPNRDDRRMILFYEAAEGGAGALRRLLDDPAAIGDIAQEALRLIHFDPLTSEDKKRAVHSKEDCEAACYDCLMNYTNQLDHPLLDRKLIRDFLLQLAKAEVKASSTEKPRAKQLEDLMRQAGSDLERRWLRFLEANSLRLPSKAQVFIEVCQTRPDFLYEDYLAAVYIDGPPHDYPERQERDRAQTECMEDHGYTVIRFHHEEDWAAKIAEHANIFGRLK